MNIAHFDCFSGISGDMTVAALLDAGVDPEPIRRGLASLGLPIKLEVNKIRKSGFAATHINMDVPHEHQHRHLHHIEAIVQKGNLSDKQRDLALRIFRRLAEAEAEAHGIPVEKVHFHEVGALDSIADVVAASIGLDLLGVERFTSAPVPTGNSTVKCDHGVMPVPTPATAILLRKVPLAASTIQAELTTPTGAAILTAIVDEWGDRPSMTIDRIGVGAGTRELAEQPNVLRLFVGTSNEPAASDRVWVLESNIDDVSAEIIGFCTESLLAAGALDVFTTPILMKKNRPGVLVTVLSPEDKVRTLEEILFRETGTFGIRRHQASRTKLFRRSETVTTPWGPISMKIGWMGERPPVLSPEHDECARAAREHGVPLRVVYDRVRLEYEAARQAKSG